MTELSAGGDLETWQAGASLAFIFGLFACIAKTAAYLFDEGGQPGAKQADYAALESRSSKNFSTATQRCNHTCKTQH